MGTIIDVGLNAWGGCHEASKQRDIHRFLLIDRHTRRRQAPLHDLLPLCERRGAPVRSCGGCNPVRLATGAKPVGKDTSDPVPA